MTKLEQMKLKVELLALTTAKADFEYKIMQREDEIDRIKENLRIQEDKIASIQKQLDAE